MTSVTSYLAGTTAGNLTLVWSLGITVPTTYAWIETWTVNPSVQTPVNRRHNFWSSEVVLDGGYPAISWDYEFIVMFHNTTTSTTPFAQNLAAQTLYTRTNSLFIGTKQLLTINDGDSLSTVRVNFGNCYLESFALQAPDNFGGWAPGGKMSLKFVGTSVPSVVF